MKKIEHFNLIKKLHTEVLEEKYGPIHSEVLQHNDFVREVYISDANNIARTYALTIFEYDKADPEICRIDKEIKEGGLIGKTFKNNGYEVRKNVTGVFTIENPNWLCKKFADNSKYSKARLSEFYARKEGTPPIIYGTVLEVYSPDFREAEINDVDQMQIHPTTSVLEQAGYTKTEIYNSLADTSSFDYSDPRYIRAQEFMRLMPDPTREKFINYIATK
jgi:hypothetical protein